MSAASLAAATAPITRRTKFHPPWRIVGGAAAAIAEVV